MVICQERGADLHMAQLMPLPLTVACYSKIQIGFTFPVPAHLGSPGKRAVKQVCMCVCVGCSACFRHSVYMCVAWRCCWLCINWTTYDSCSCGTIPLHVLLVFCVRWQNLQHKYGVSSLAVSLNRSDVCVVCSSSQLRICRISLI